MTRVRTSWDYLFQGNHFKAKRVCAVISLLTNLIVDCIIYVGYRDKDHDYQVISWSHARKWPRVYGSLLTKYTHDFDCSDSSDLRTEHTIKNFDFISILFSDFTNSFHSAIRRSRKIELDTKWWNATPRGKHLENLSIKTLNMVCTG